MSVSKKCINFHFAKYNLNLICFYIILASYFFKLWTLIVEIVCWVFFFVFSFK